MKKLLLYIFLLISAICSAQYQYSPFSSLPTGNATIDTVNDRFVWMHWNGTGFTDQQMPIKYVLRLAGHGGSVSLPTGQIAFGSGTNTITSSSSNTWIPNPLSYGDSVQGNANGWIDYKLGYSGNSGMNIYSNGYFLSFDRHTQATILTDSAGNGFAILPNESYFINKYNSGLYIIGDSSLIRNMMDNNSFIAGTEAPIVKTANSIVSLFSSTNKQTNLVLQSPSSPIRDTMPSISGTLALVSQLGGAGVDTGTNKSALSVYRAQITYVPFADSSASSTWNKKYSSLFGLHDSLLNYQQTKDSNTKHGFSTIYNVLHQLALFTGTTNITTLGTVTTGTLSTGAVLGGVTTTLGSDATGDIYYRNSSGVLTRLPIGSSTNVLTVSGGLPSWAAAGGGSAWLQTGNSGLSRATNYIGTNDTIPFAGRVSDTNSLWIDYQSAYANAMFGFGSGKRFTTAHFNTGIGYWSLFYNTIGTGNTAIGYEALVKNKSGSSITAIGKGCLYNTTAGFNTGVGDSCLYYNTSGNSNASIGNSSLLSNTTGSSNCSMGYQALITNTTGNRNTAEGYQSLDKNTTGNNNTGLGNNSLFGNITGSGSTAVGNYSLRSTTGSRNTSVGDSSGNNNISGTNNTFIGYNSIASSNAATNATAIGNGAVATASNVCDIGNSSLTFLQTYAQLEGQGSAPTIVAGAAAGSGILSPVVSDTGTALGVTVVVTTGTTTTTGVICTITLPTAALTGCVPVLCAGNSLAALLSGATMVYVTGSKTQINIYSGTSALTGAGTTYSWHLTWVTF